MDAMGKICMERLGNLLIAAVAACGFSVMAEAQPPYPHQIPPGDPTFEAVITKLLGEGFNESERAAVQRCGSAAMQQAAVQYWPWPDSNFYRSDLQRFPGGQGINPAAKMRVTAISEVRRRKDGVHVSGLIDARAGYPLYGPVDGKLINVYGAADGLSFSCNVDFGGIVSNLRTLRR
jgi:hypothetical protein